MAAMWNQSTSGQHRYSGALLWVQSENNGKVSCVLQENSPVGDLTQSWKHLENINGEKK